MLQNSALKGLLMNRMVTQAGAADKTPLTDGVMPTAPSGLPAPPPNAKQHESPALKRYLTAQRMMNAISHGWQPSPTLVKVLEGER